ncbi:unnamed protein product [Adineta steineri]|uniref:Poly [ADP-ribose] polymerase n=2 Tax=Adineta steineri TaxID=433720 RepID=A0A814QTS2_9BILA|nr:unnamed protein product [Adineta steineri]CAF3637292.1 unnamed protein product [Adineta steineri]
MSVLNGKTFVLELGSSIRFKAKQELINYLRQQNANISYILTASTDYVLVSNDIDTYKTRRAKQLGIPLLNVEYIYECRNLSIEKEPPNIKRFIVTSAEDKENFSKTGTIPVSGGGNSSTSAVKPIKFDLSKIKIWNSDDVELPQFDEITHAEIGKWAIFKETNDNSDIYFALELQIIPEEYINQINNNNYRLRVRYEKQTITSLKGKISVIQYAFSNDINELHQLFASYYYRIATMPRITRIRDLLPDKLGSKLLLRSLFLHRIDTQMLDDNICQLIESLWIESIGDLNKILSVPPESIALKTIIEAEAALLEIKSDSDSASQAETRFYSLIPHQQSYVIDLIKNRRALIDKIDLCQMLRDMATVNELTNWNVKASIEAKYRALKCHIESIENNTLEYTTISNMIHSSTNTNEEVIIHHVYSVAKQTDVLNFRSTLFNQKQLFHGSKYNNFLGILSRGLLMPKMVVNDLGITRTDIGCLGYGVYFSDSVSTSLKYTTSSVARPGRRLLCISQVALGDSAKFYSYAPNLIEPPENFHSTHGVKNNTENNSRFIDDEYVVYNLDQQKLLYIVEVSWKPYDSINETLSLLPIVRDYLTNQSNISKNEIDIPTAIEDEAIEVAEQDYGLICPSSGQLVPLKAFHIRAQLVDVTAEVVLYQVYHNTSTVPIEAKYVFPLDENCSVCGFEAHINNKIIKGVVKEKEQAKREYREAIEKGHGAYLMHQEQPEVFSVSVGNLPANCEVIIKITYVAELPIENNDIIFRLPAKVASWQSKQALDMKDQTILPSINLEQDNSSMKSVAFSLKASIRMPYEIMKLFSPTHRLRRKITDCIAMIELVDNILFEKDFILSITLKSINLPRMLNETYVLSDENNNTEINDENSQACMLIFYPKFEMINNANEYIEIVFLIDVSNSMDGNHVQQAKQLAHLFLTNMKNTNGNIYFNIVTFGSDNDECFPISSLNTNENIDKAKHFILHSLDHRGNTDLFSVLRQYSLLPSPSKLGRQFILLSDGHINDLKSILQLFKTQSSMIHDRLFTCSIGDTSNKHNLKQLANGTHGGGLTTVFDSNYRSRWKTKVLLILEHIRQPCVNNISIDWHGNIDNQQEKFTNQAPKMIRSLFNGMRLTVYRFIQNCHKATLTAMINNQEFNTTVFSNKITETKGRILHCLTARAIIHDYENGLLHIDESENELIKKQYKQDLIKLSMKYSVVSSFTSFVAIEERDGEALEPGVRLLDVMLENDIDLLPYVGWDGDRSQTDLMKEKLLNAKRLFDSASVSSKIDLSNEYESFCQNISYRSGGDAKYDLMLTIIDTYRMTLKENEKARELENKMQLDLLNEINNATADERKLLEKRLDEINIRIESEKSQNFENQSITSEQSESELTCANDYVCDEYDDDDNYLMETNDSLGNKAAKVLLPTDSDSLSDSDNDMGFGLFDDYGETASSIACATSFKRTRAMPATINTSKDEDEEEDGDDMCGFDLFGEGGGGGGFSSSSKSTSKENKSFVLREIAPSKSAVKEKKSWADVVEEEECDMGFALFGDEDFAPPQTINHETKEKTTNKDKESAKEIILHAKPKAFIPTLRQRLNQTSDIISQIECNIASATKQSKSAFTTSPSYMPTSVNEAEEKLQKKSFKISKVFDGALQKQKKTGFLTESSKDKHRQQLVFPPQQQQLQPQQQQQQQQQQQLRISSPTPPTTSDLFSLITDSFALASDAYNSRRCDHLSLISKDPFEHNNNNNNKNDSLTLDGFYAPSNFLLNALPPPPPLLNASPYLWHPNAPPPPPPGATSQLFGNSTSNTTTSFGTSPYSSSAMFSSTAPPPPPPPSFLSSTPSLFGSSTSNTTFSSGASPFGGPPPPAPIPSSTSALFGSSTTISGAAPSFGGSAMFSATAPPPPVPFPSSASALNGSRTSNTTFSFGALPSGCPPPPALFPSSTSALFGSSTTAPFGASPFSDSATFSATSLPPPPPPPPAPFPPSTSALFGSSTTTSIAAPSFGGPSMYYTAGPPPPVPFPSSASALFGNSTSNTTFCSNVPPSNYSPMYNVPAYLPQLPQPPSGASIANIAELNRSSDTMDDRVHLAPINPVLPKASSLSKTSFSFTNDRRESNSDDSRSMRINSSYRDRDQIPRSPMAYMGGDQRGGGGSRGSRGAKTSSISSQSKRMDESNFEQIEESITRSSEIIDTHSAASAQFYDMELDVNNDGSARESMSTIVMDDELSYVGKRSNKKKLPLNSNRETRVTQMQDLLLLDVTPLSLGIEDVNGQMCIIIPRNSTIPRKAQLDSVFTNAYAYQTTATIRIFRGEHKSTKYNTFLGEFVFPNLTSNFTSKTLEISISMDLDANDLLIVNAEESRSGAKAMIKINLQEHHLTPNDIERHLQYVRSNPDYQAITIDNQQMNNSLYMLKGDTENRKINFSGEIEISKDFPIFPKFKTISLTSTIMNELKRIQLSNGSFNINEDFVKLLSIDMKNFDELKEYLYKQGFNSFALNTQNDIIHLIATGIILLEFLLQVPLSERNELLIPFNGEQIRSLLHRHLPKPLLENADKAIDFYAQKRLSYGIYCQQLELKYSSWEKLIQYGIFNIEN